MSTVEHLIELTEARIVEPNQEAAQSTVADLARDFSADLGGEAVVLITTKEAAHGVIEPALHRARESVRQANDLVDVLTPDVDVPPPPLLLQARRNAELRLRLLRDYGALVSDQVAELSGSRASNRSALAHRWRQEGRVFAVPFRNRWYFPAFQFDGEGKPKEILGDVIVTFDSHGASPWEIGLWFISPHPRLEGSCPVDVLDENPASVAAAARQTFDIPS